MREVLKQSAALVIQETAPIENLTDLGNARRLVTTHGKDLRYCHAFGKWLIWDGKRWELDGTEEITRRMKEVVKTIYAEAALQTSLSVQRRLERHARRSEAEGKIRAAISLAQSERELVITPNKIDQQPWLLNCANGTLDLKSMELREHRREDLITKFVHFSYDPKAECPQFMRFVNQIMGDGPDASEPDRERADRLVSFLQKCFGYSLTGDVSEKAVFCFFGCGSNGKTTLLEAVRFVLMEYSTQVLVDSLLTHHGRESNAALADLSDLRGARFVTTSEPEEGARLAVGKLKYLTQGTSSIKSCRKYENPICFPASHKLFLDANHKPAIRGAEKAVWNRLKPVPFTVTISLEDMDKGHLAARV